MATVIKTVFVKEGRIEKATNLDIDHILANKTANSRSGKVSHWDVWIGDKTIRITLGRSSTRAQIAEEKKESRELVFWNENKIKRIWEKELSSICCVRQFFIPESILHFYKSKY